MNINQEKAQHQQAARKMLLLEKQARSNQSRYLEQPSTDSDTELVAESIAIIHQSNARLGGNLRMGGNSTNNPWTIQQAIKGVSLPVFRNMLPRKYLYRYDLKLQVLASEDVVATLLQVTKTFWAQILSTDNKAVLVPWMEEHQHELPLLTSLEKFPSMLSNLRKYFSRAQPNIRGQTLYMSILLGHNMLFLDIMENVWWWLSEKKFGLWKRQVQSETVKTIGYLLYSTRSLEPEYMKQIVEKAVNKHKNAHKYGKHLELGFRW